MKYPSREYSELVERKQNEIRGNVSSVKLTPQECEAEIKAVTGGAFEMSLAEGGTLEAGAGLHDNAQANSLKCGAYIISKAVDRKVIDASGNLIIAEGATPILDTIAKKRGWPKGKKRGPRGGKNPFK